MPKMKWKAFIFFVVLLAVPEFAAAQAPGPTSPPHPSMPWSGPRAPGSAGSGTVVRYIEVPPQQTAVPVYVPGPGSFPGEYQDQVVEVPGYVITETTTGYLYPERLTLQQVTPGVYQWVTVPQQFQPK